MRWLIYIAIVCIIVLLVIYLKKSSAILDSFTAPANPLYINGFNADVVDLSFLSYIYSTSVGGQSNPSTIAVLPQNYANLCWQRGMKLVSSNDELINVIQSADDTIKNSLSGKNIITMDGNVVNNGQIVNVSTLSTINDKLNIKGVCIIDTPLNRFTNFGFGNVMYIIRVSQTYTESDTAFGEKLSSDAKQKNHGPITPNLYQMSVTNIQYKYATNQAIEGSITLQSQIATQPDDIYCGDYRPPYIARKPNQRLRDDLMTCYIYDVEWLGDSLHVGSPSSGAKSYEDTGIGNGGGNFAKRFFKTDAFGQYRPATQQEIAYARYLTNNNLASLISDTVTNNDIEKEGSKYQFIVGPANSSFKKNTEIFIYQPTANDGDLTYGRKLTAHIVSNSITTTCTPDTMQKCETMMTNHTKETGQPLTINTIEKNTQTQKYKTSEQLLDIYQNVTNLIPGAEECFNKCIFFGNKTYSACSAAACDAKKAALRNSLTAFNTFSIDDCKFCPPDSNNPSETLACTITNNTVMTCATPGTIRLPQNEPYKIHVYSIVNPNDGTSGSYQIDLFSKYADIANDATGVFVVQDSAGANQIIYNFQPGQITIKSSTNNAPTSAWTSNIPIPIIYNKYPQVIHVNVYKKPLTGWAAGVIPPPVLKGEAPLGASTCVAVLSNNIITGTLQQGLALPYGSYHLIIRSTSGVGAERVVSSLLDKTVYFDGSDIPTFNTFTLDINTSTFRLGTSPTLVTTKIINSPRNQVLQFFLQNPAKTIQYFGEPSVQVPASSIIAAINTSSGEQGVDYQVDFKDSANPSRIRSLRPNTPYILSVLAGAPGSMPAAMTEVLSGNYNPDTTADISGFLYNRFNNSITIGTTTINGTPPRDTTTPRQFRFNVSIDDAVVQGFRSGGGSKRAPALPQGVEPQGVEPQGVEPFALQTIFDSSGAVTEPTESILLSYANANTIRGTFTVGTQTVALAAGKYAIQFAINGSTANIPRVEVFGSTATRLMRFEITMQTGELTAYSTPTATIGSPNATPIKFKRNAYTLSATLIETTTGTVILSSGRPGLAVYATHYDAMPPLGADTGDELFLVKPATGGGITSSESEIASRIGTIEGATRATLQQVREALYMGANWTEAGWIASDNGSPLPTRAVYPLSDEYVVQRYSLPNFANMAGDELAPLDKKKVVAYLPADGKAAGVLMYGKKPASTATLIIVPWNTYRRIAKKADTESNNEVYPVELLSTGSTIPVSGATEICDKFNASVALETDLQTAAERGADWCKPGWTQRTYRVGDVANLVTAAHPVNESSTINACSPDGRRKTAVIDGAAAQGSGARAQVVNCYGVKRAETANTVEGYAARPFNARTSAWSQDDAADYTTYYFRNQKAIAGETDLFKRAKLMVDEARRTGALLRRAGSDIFKGCDINAEACFPRTSGVSAPTLREVVQPVSKTGRYMGVDLDDNIVDGDSAIVKEEKAIRWIIDCQEKKGGAVQLGPGEEYPGCGDGLRCCAPESIYGLNAGMFGTDPDCPAAGVTEEDCVKDTKLPTATVPRLGLKNPGMIKPKCVESVGGSLQSIRTIANNLKANKLSALRMGSGLK